MKIDDELFCPGGGQPVLEPARAQRGRGTNESRRGGKREANNGEGLRGNRRGERGCGSVPE